MLNHEMLYRMKLRNWREWSFLVACWLLIVTALWQRRSYQDSWVLDGVLIPTVLVVISFAILMVKEMASSRKAIWAAVFITVLRWIPGLKYAYAYGSSIDQAVHIASIDHLIGTGFPPPGTAYTAVPGLHTVLSGMALLSESSPEQAAKYGFPLLLGLFPLIVYWFCRQFRMNDKLRGQIVLAAAFVFDPYYLLLQGTPFGSLLFFLLVAWFLLREFGTAKARLPYSIGLAAMIISLLFGHAISSLTVAIVIMSTFVLLPIILTLFRAPASPGTLFGGGQFLALLLLMLAAWWLFPAHELFTAAIEQLDAAVHGSASAKLPVPSRLFELPVADMFRTLYLSHGSTIALLTMSTAGVMTIWKRKAQISSEFRTSLIIMVAIEAALALTVAGQMLAGFGELEYFRLIGYAVVFSPFFAGFALWQLREESRTGWILVVTAFLLLSLPQIFPFQPAVPKAGKAAAALDGGEPVLYLHTVVSSFEANMLRFAYLHAPKEGRIDSDRLSRDTSLRLLGWNSFSTAVFDGYDGAKEALDGGNWEILLLHQPGASGPFSERAEYRSSAEISRIVSEPEYSLVYSNGMSFILSRP